MFIVPIRRTLTLIVTTTEATAQISDVTLVVLIFIPENCTTPNTMTNSTVLHIRAETKPLECRTAVPPTTAKHLVDAGYTVNVERSKLNIFDDSEYEKTGATLVPTGSWKDAPSEHIIVGLKELPEDDFPLKHSVSFRRFNSYAH